MILFKPIVRSLFSTKLPAPLAACYFSNVLIALASATLYLTASDISDTIHRDEWFGTAFLFGTTLVHYSLHDWYSKVYRCYSPQRPRALYWQRHWRWLLVLPALALATLPWLAWHWLTVSRFVWLLFFGGLASIYSFPLLPARWRLRRHPLLKLTVLAVTWAVLPVVLASPAGWPGTAQVWLMFQRSLLLLLICIPFDWRDADHDRAVGVRTLPDYWSAVQASTWLVVLAAAHLLVLLGTTPLPVGFIPLLIACLPTGLAFVLAVKALRHPVWPLGYLLLDALLILQSLVVGALQHLAYIR